MQFHKRILSKLPHSIFISAIILAWIFSPVGKYLNFDIQIGDREFEIALAPTVKEANAYTSKDSVTSAGTTTWIVPVGVTDVLVKVWGAGGGGGAAGDDDTNIHTGGGGGGGGFSRAILDVTPGQTLSLRVGDNGALGAATGGTTDCGAGGGGGGFSGIWNGSSYVIIAGGGAGGGGGMDDVNETGGGGGAGGGGNGSNGLTGQNLSTAWGDFGDGATTGAVGAGGSNSTQGNGVSGAGRQGGTGTNGSGGAGGAPGGGAGSSCGTNIGGSGGGGGGAFGGGGAESGTDEGGGGGGGGSGLTTGLEGVTTVAGTQGANAGTAGAGAGDTDPDYSGTVGDGGAGGATVNANGSNGNDGKIVLIWTNKISVSGTLYKDEGKSAQTSSKTIKLFAATSSTSAATSTTSNGGGAFSFGGIEGIATGTPITLWVDADTAFRASAVTVASTTLNNISSVNLYQNRVILKHEDLMATSTTLAKLKIFDRTNDSDIQFDVDSNNDLVIQAGNMLYIAPGTHLSTAIEANAGDEIFIHGGVTSDAQNSIKFAFGPHPSAPAVSTSSIVTLGGNLTVGGSWFASTTGAIFNHNSKIVIFSGTSTGKSIYASSTPFYNLTFDGYNNTFGGGTGGGWTFQEIASSTAALTITDGTVTAPPWLSIGGNFTNNSTFTAGTGTTTFDGTAVQTLSGTMTGLSAFKNIEFNSSSGDWYNADWAYRKKISLKQASSTLNEFPVLVSLSDTDLAARAQADGDDILFTSSNGTTRLSHEIETYTSGGITAWVKVPTLSSSGITDIYMYYGNAATSSEETPTQAWNSNYKGVWHLSETPDTTSTSTNTIYDSTSNNQDGWTEGNMTTTDQTFGKVNGGLDFDGLDDRINVPDFSNSSQITVETWFKFDDALNANAGLVSNDSFGNGDVHFKVNNNILYADPAGDGGVTTSSVLNLSNWYHGAYSFTTSGNLILYVNGQEVARSTAGSTDWNGTGIKIGHEHTSYVESDRYFDGRIDEARISNTVRSSDWIIIQYGMMSATSTFYSNIGSQEESGSSGVILNNNASTTHMMILDGGVRAPSLLSVSGNFTNAGTFNANSGTTTFNGTSQQYVGGIATGTNAFAGLEILNTTASTTITAAASSTGMLTASPGARIEFKAGATTTVQNISFNGTEGNEIYLHTIPTPTGPSEDWYHEDWLYRKKITLKQASSTLTNFPVLISLSDTDLAARAQADGDDILFTSSNGTTRLPHDLDEYGSGGVNAWVKLPTLSSSAATDMYMYYGNAATSSEELATTTWANNYDLVLHLSEDRAGADDDLLYNDYSGGLRYGVDGVENGNTKTGKIGQGQGFGAGAGDDWTRGANADSITLATTDHAFELWMRGDEQAETSDFGMLLSHFTGGAPGAGYFIGVRDSTSRIEVNYRETSGANSLSLASANTVYESGGWHYVAVRVDTTNKLGYLYIDGNLHASDGYGGTLIDKTGYPESSWWLGCTTWDGCSTVQYTGNLDEVRISNGSNRSADWFTISYDMMNATSTFYTSIGTEETDSGGGDNIQWNFEVPGGRSVSYVNVKDSNACYTAGNNIPASNSTDGGNNDCWTLPGIAGTLTIANHDVGQESNKFNTSTLDDTELFAFKMTPTTESFTTTIVFSIEAFGISQSDITNVQLFEDSDGSGGVNGAEGSSPLGGSGTVALSGNTGTITFSSFTVSSAKNYLMRADVSNIVQGASLSINLNKARVTATGVSSSQSITPSGTISQATHSRGDGNFNAARAVYGC